VRQRLVKIWREAVSQPDLLQVAPYPLRSYARGWAPHSHIVCSGRYETKFGDRFTALFGCPRMDFVVCGQAALLIVGRSSF
jgi:hypothetical protein